MLNYLFSLSFILILGNPQTPNYYPNYASAREASKTMKKELLVFFTDNNCSSCESAWAAYTKDETSVQHYVCTRLNIRDFDGSVFFDHFHFKKVPAWVILTPGAEMEEKWEGGWKDENGNPTSYDINTTQNKVLNETKIAGSSQEIKIQSLKDQSSLNTEKVSVINSPKENTTIKSITEKPTTVKENEGFIIQAGYFGSEANAKKLINDLTKKGFSGFKIEHVQKNGTIFYRVISNSFMNESDVNLEQHQLSNAGFKTAIK